MIDYKMLNGANLAFIGDAYYELYIRCYIIEKGLTNAHKIHAACTKYVSAKGHQKIVNRIKDVFTEEENNIFKRGRNHKYSSRRKNIDIAAYIDSSGLEAVIGYLYLKSDYPRIEEIMRKSISIIEESNE